MSKNTHPYKVSVSIITYNQVDCISKAVDSVIAQEVDFRYEIIIGDDCSTDGTREILLDYKQRHPDLIKLNLHEKRGEGIAGRKNNITNIRSARGEYIAFCDGDDYWLSEDKLQKQADFMDAHPEYSFCFHDSLMINLMEEKEYVLSTKKYVLRKSKSFTLKDILRKRTVIPSSSTFYRKKMILPLPEWFWYVYAADRFLQLLAARNGPAKYMKDLKYVRVLHANSVSNYLDSELQFARIKKNDISIIEHNFKDKSFKPITFEAIFYLRRASIYLKNGEYRLMTMSFCKAIDEDMNALWLILDKAKSKFRSYLLKN